MGGRCAELTAANAGFREGHTARCPVASFYAPLVTRDPRGLIRVTPALFCCPSRRPDPRHGDTASAVASAVAIA
jgi:hypothetical protein